MTNTDKMVQVGWWVVGHDGAKHGRMTIGQKFLTMFQAEHESNYYETRGYTLIPAYAKLADETEFGVE